MNLRTLQRANVLRREAILANDCPILHGAADSAMRLLVAENNDRVLVARAEARLARRPRSFPPGSSVAHYCSTRTV